MPTTEIVERLFVAELQLTLCVYSGVCDRLKRLVRENIDMDGILLLSSYAFRDDLLEKIAGRVKSYEETILEIVKNHISGQDEEKTPLQETILSSLTDCAIMQKSVPANLLPGRLYFKTIGDWMSEKNRNTKIKEIWDMGPGFNMSNTFIFCGKRDLCMMIKHVGTDEMIDCRMAPDFETRITCE